MWNKGNSKNYKDCTNFFSRWIPMGHITQSHNSWSVGQCQCFKLNALATIVVKKCKQTTASNKFLLVLFGAEFSTVLKLFSSLWLSPSSSDLIYLYALSNFETPLFYSRLRVAVWMTKILGFHAGKLSDLLYAVYKCL